MISLFIIAVILQLFVMYYGMNLYKLIKPVKIWTVAWMLFTISMVLVTIRRGFGVWEMLQTGGCPAGMELRTLLEGQLLIAISVLWLVFVYQLKQLFYKIINGELLLLDRRETVAKREMTAQAREITVGRREMEVYDREEFLVTKATKQDGDNTGSKTE